MHEAPILLIDSDEDDQAMFIKALAELKSPHPPLFFDEGEAALDYITSSDIVPFLILSDVSLLKMSGLEMRREIEKSAELRKKSIPFIFITHPVDERTVEHAYEFTIQGLFEKKASYAEWVSQLGAILAYWSACYHPKQFQKS